MDVPSTSTISSEQSETSTPSATVSGEITVPLLAKVNMGGGISTASGANETVSKTSHGPSMARVAREIANSEFLVFLDDFHYIGKDLQESVGRQIKAAAEVGIRFCIASVPHRSDDMVRSNHELRGRTINIDTSFWSKDDLVKIGIKGFEELNFDVPLAAIKSFAHEICTSPQIMQSLCLQMCFNKDCRERVHAKRRVSLNSKDIQEILEEASSRADYSSLLRQMHAGPRVRGTERKEFDFYDRSRGDAYRAALLALKANPPSMSYDYADLLARIAKVCVDEKPVGSSVTESLKQISAAAERMHPNQKIVEWDPDASSGTFSIMDPYFLFFLRSSHLIKTLSS